MTLPDIKPFKLWPLLLVLVACRLGQAAPPDPPPADPPPAVIAAVTQPPLTPTPRSGMKLSPPTPPQGGEKSEVPPCAQPPCGTGGLGGPTSVPNLTETPTPQPTSDPTPTPSPTPDPYAGLTIAGLANRAYGGGELRIEETMAVTAAFTRSLVSYPSDGLTLYGFMNVPQGDGPFPVALVMHGYVPPDRYNTLGYTSRYADALARAGYLVLHPNYRNYPPSGSGPDLFRASHAVDALNLVAIIRAQAGQPGPLEKAGAGFVGMLGHSMGGGITLRAITISPAIQAAVLYGSMSGDEQQNFEKIREWSGGSRGLPELDVPPEDLERIGPIYHLDRISAAVSIHHGDYDGTVPLAWSEDLCRRLQDLQKVVECFTYPGQPHTFQGEGDQLFIQRTVDFFNRVRAGGAP